MPDYQLSLYINREDLKKMEDEYSSAFIRDTLVNILGDAIVEFWPEESESLSIKQKIELKTILARHNISLVYQGKEIKIYVEQNLTAHWKVPRYILKYDRNQVVPSKRVYYEMIIEYYSVFES